ncbi:hypothetical protein C0991_002294 [Blastosporella zonata]|nr:hypothetical protein C0991_002294 [Blastosporella zonata]
MSGVASAGTGGMEGFYSEISSLQDGLGNLRANVARIGDLHSRTLEITNDPLAQNHATQLEDFVEETRILIANLKQRIKDLEMQPSSERDARTRKQQIALVRSKFVEAIQHYQTVEQEYRSKYKQRIERQYKIQFNTIRPSNKSIVPIKPDASPEEVKAVVDSERSGQIFAEAVCHCFFGFISKGFMIIAKIDA